MNLAGILNKLNAIIQDNPAAAEYDVVVLCEHEDADNVSSVSVGYGHHYPSDLCIEDHEIDEWLIDNGYDSELQMVEDMNLRKIILIE